MNFWKDVEKDRNAKEYEATLENLDVEFTIERTLEYNDYIREVGHRRRQVMATSDAPRRIRCCMAPESKKDGDQLKLCRNAMRTLNKLLITIPKDRARVYLVQSFNGLDGFIEIKYLVRPIPSIYILQRFKRTKLPASFGDFEQFANDLKDLMNWKADVLSTVRAVNKAIAVDNTRGDNNLHLTSIEDTPLKKRKAEKNQTSSPKSPCPGGSPSEFSPLI
ncbi:hypothetical protein RhiirA4_460418 [Rhizophagus irregularis]|uniref:Uncharacterized protein n=1 Tax=Rhizophagus irregularis TaxID=588596 RepID=A0A2I1GGK8_9GLOM|nr:hypothetical protein RhiirA4_460418 [Rhizophagus irregularis]